jgi:hypothetical protein
MPKGQNLFVCSTYPKTKNSISFDHFTFTSSSFDIGPRAHLSICCALHPTMPLSLGRALLLRPAVSLLRPVRAAAIPAEQGFRTSFPSKIPVGIFGLAKLSTGPKTDSHSSDCSPWKVLAVGMLGATFGQLMVIPCTSCSPDDHLSKAQDELFTKLIRKDNPGSSGSSGSWVWVPEFVEQDDGDNEFQACKIVFTGSDGFWKADCSTHFWRNVRQKISRHADARHHETAMPLLLHRIGPCLWSLTIFY